MSVKCNKGDHDSCKAPWCECECHPRKLAISAHRAMQKVADDLFCESCRLLIERVDRKEAIIIILPTGVGYYHKECAE